MNTNKHKWIYMAVLAAAAALHVGTAQANYLDLLKTLEDNNALSPEQAATLRDKAPQARVRPATSGVVKDLQIRGRIQTQFGYVDAKNDEGSDEYHTFEVRRARIGLRGTFFDDFRAEIEANLVPGSELSMRTAYIQWRKHKPAYVKVGYDKPHTSLEEGTSSAEILTIERTVINGLVGAPGEMTGLTLDGGLGWLYYGAGVYTDANNKNGSNADARYFYSGLVGIKLDEWVGDTQQLRLQGVYMNSDDTAGKFGARFDDAFTVAGHFKSGAFDLRAEYLLGDADGMDTKGFYVMPSLYLTDAVQAVIRYEQAESDKARGIRAPSRYTRDVPALKVRETLDEAGDVVSRFDPQAGDEYQAVYLGVNYYFAGHGHKLMFGVELSELKNTDAGKLEATTVSTAWRMLF